MDYSDSSSSANGKKWRGGGDTPPFDSRPVSRRGIREYSNNYSVSSFFRTNNMRPGSSHRGVTASRLGSASFAPPTMSGRSTAFHGLGMSDRPITQHGVSGLRTGTSRGYRARQLQDKRYWEDILQVKIRELKAEIGNLNEQADAKEREKSANKHYERRVKEMAQELTDLQGRLSDYNTTIRISSGALNRDELIDQTKQLEESNLRAESTLENIFLDRQRKENQLKQLREQVDKEQSMITHFMTTMSPPQRDKYEQLRQEASQLRDEAEIFRTQLDEVEKEKQNLLNEISTSQIKMHMIELNRRLNSAEKQRDDLMKEISNKIKPEEEKEQLLTQVREDNAAIASMENSAATIKQQIKKVEDLIEQSEQDLEEGQSERYQKFRDLKKREEVMESFMSKYEESLQAELDKIAQLESDVVFALEHGSSNIDMDLSEIDLLKQKDGVGIITALEGDGKKNVEDLNKEIESLNTILKKTEERRQRITTELNQLPEKIKVMKEELVIFVDLEKVRNEGVEKRRNLEVEIKTLQNKLTPTESAVVEAANKLKSIQASLEGNDLYDKLNELENKLTHLENTKNILEEDIASITLKADYNTTKKQALENVGLLNKCIIQELDGKSGII